MATKFCIQCGANLVVGAKFCENCGKEIEWNNSKEEHQETVESHSGIGNSTMAAEPIVEVFDNRKSEVLDSHSNSIVEESIKSDFPEKGITKQFFNYKGRLNRLRYIKRKLVLFLFFYMPVGMINAILSQPTVYHELLTYLLWIVVIGGTVSELCLMARRIRDIQPAYVVGANYLRLRMLAIIFCMLFQIFFPPLGLICILINIYLLCAKGTNGTNIYGRDPLEV